MKIINRQKLMKFKNRIVFSKVYGTELNGLYVYEDNLVSDFVLTNLLGFPQSKDSKGHQGIEDFDLITGKKEFELDLECCSRDGLYDDNQLYAIYDKTDLLKLINKLQSIYIENYTE